MGYEERYFSFWNRNSSRMHTDHKISGIEISWEYIFPHKLDSREYNFIYIRENIVKPNLKVITF